MNQRQQILRHAADRAFMESLNQLQETLKPADEPVQSTMPASASQREAEVSLAETFDLSQWEQAVADIEQFMQKRQQEGDEIRN